MHNGNGAVEQMRSREAERAICTVSRVEEELYCERRTRNQS